MRPLYFDHNATTPLLAEVAEAIERYNLAGHANPSSLHGPGREARRVLEAAREQIASLLGADVSGPQADRVVFCSGGTEANNLAILGICTGSPAHVITTPIEHPSVLGPCEHLAQLGWTVDHLPVSQAGVVDPATLDALLRPDTRLVSVMLANNETGALQPVDEIVRRCASSPALVHTDAVQAAGKIAVDFRALGVDAMTVTAHKLHGPLGIGALVLRHDVPISPQLYGGFQQGSLRPGTENVALAVGFAKALEIAVRDLRETATRLQQLRDDFEQRLCRAFPEIVVNASAAPRLPHVSNLAMVGANRQALMVALDLAGIACSTGSACASGSTDPSPTLVAMGLKKPVVDGSLRFSFGRPTTVGEIDRAVHEITRVFMRFSPRKEDQKTASGSSR